jgi:class 3 adenylate cyclase
MFTDIADSTPMTARLGDTRAVEMIRAHDSVVRRALNDKNGREVKHTGDGIMACFVDAVAAADCACSIQHGFLGFNSASSEKLRVRIGIDVGEPVADSNDLFGSTVQMAARLCQAAEPEAILISSAVQRLLHNRFQATPMPPRVLKGFDEPVTPYRLNWN